MLRCFRSRRSLIIITGSNSPVAAASTKDARDTLSVRLASATSRHNAKIRSSSPFFVNCSETLPLFHSFDFRYRRHNHGVCLAPCRCAGWRNTWPALRRYWVSTYRGRLARCCHFVKVRHWLERIHSTHSQPFKRWLQWPWARPQAASRQPYSGTRKAKARLAKSCPALMAS